MVSILHPTLDLVLEMTDCSPIDGTLISLRPLRSSLYDQEQAWSLELSSLHEVDPAQVVYSLQHPPAIEYGASYTVISKATNTVAGHDSKISRVRKPRISPTPTLVDFLQRCCSIHSPHRCEHHDNNFLSVCFKECWWARIRTEASINRSVASLLGCDIARAAIQHHLLYTVDV